jgi:hypothetical protein
MNFQAVHSLQFHPQQPSTGRGGGGGRGGRGVSGSGSRANKEAVTGGKVGTTSHHVILQQKNTHSIDDGQYGPCDQVDAPRE